MGESSLWATSRKISESTEVVVPDIEKRLSAAEVTIARLETFLTKMYGETAVRSLMEVDDV